MLKTLLLIVLAALVLLLAYAATRPDTFRVERSAQIQAPPDRLFPLINDLRAFNTWNPYEKKIPRSKAATARLPSARVRRTLGKATKSAWGKCASSRRNQTQPSRCA